MSRRRATHVLFSFLDRDNACRKISTENKRGDLRCSVEALSWQRWTSVTKGWTGHRGAEPLWRQSLAGRCAPKLKSSYIKCEKMKRNEKNLLSGLISECQIPHFYFTFPECSAVYGEVPCRQWHSLNVLWSYSQYSNVDNKNSRPLFRFHCQLTSKIYKRIWPMTRTMHVVCVCCIKTGLQIQ